MYYSDAQRNSHCSAPLRHSCLTGIKLFPASCWRVLPEKPSGVPVASAALPCSVLPLAGVSGDWDSLWHVSSYSLQLCLLKAAMQHLFILNKYVSEEKEILQPAQWTDKKKKNWLTDKSLSFCRKSWRLKYSLSLRDTCLLSIYWNLIHH